MANCAHKPKIDIYYVLCKIYIDICVYVHIAGVFP